MLVVVDIVMENYPLIHLVVHLLLYTVLMDYHFKIVQYLIIYAVIHHMQLL